jgi:hypothetical protein
MSYILRGRWFNIIFLNVYAQRENKKDDVKDSFYQKLGRVFDQFPRYDPDTFSDDLNANVRGEDIFKAAIGNESSYEISNDKGFRVLYFDTSKNLVV